MFAQFPHAADKTDIMSAIEAMRFQEDAAYHCTDYLSNNDNDNNDKTRVNQDCRRKMIEWCYQVVDYCKFNRETVSIAISLLDRYLDSPAGQEVLGNRKVFQLVSMTCLYTAVKVHEPEAMEPKTIAGLSRGAYTEEQVTKAELQILMGVKWRVNPPTAMAFVQHYLSLLFSTLTTLSAKDKVALLNVARFQTELAVYDYTLSSVQASRVALAAVANAMHSVGLSVETQEAFLCGLARLLRIREDAHDVQMKLYEAVQSASVTLLPRNSIAESLVEEETVEYPSQKSARTAANVSPRCVASTER